MKKITIISALFMIFVSFLCNCYAFEIGEKELIPLGKCGKFLKYYGKERDEVYVVYEKDGKQYPAYCINAELIGVVDQGYNVIGESKLQNVDAWRAIINGYPYKTLEELGAKTKEEAYTATKFAVYTLMYNRDTNVYSPIDTEEGRRTYQIYLDIVNNARKSTETIVNDLAINVIPIDLNWKVDEIDSECVSKTYCIESKVNSGNYEVEVQGLLPEGTKIVNQNNELKNKFKLNEKFKILIPIKNLTQNENFVINVKSELETKPIVYGASTLVDRQNYALTGYMYEDTECTYTEGYMKNNTQIQIVKQDDESEKRLEGVKFNLLDSNKNIIMENLKTNESGEVILENMIPGKYYLQEIETLENYSLYTDLIEINLQLNEEFKVIVNNSIKKINNTENKIENVEVTSKYTEEEYIEKNIQNNIIEENVIVKKLPVTGY